MICHLDYIPKRLHTNKKPTNPIFEVGENLYYRCKENECLKPYDKISLYDISHNRNFGSPEDYPKEDVFYNILEDDPQQVYPNLSFTILTLKNIENEQTFKKEVISLDDTDLKALIWLKHDPLPCMYTHSVFEVSVNKIIVNKENYGDLLNEVI